jgi:regulator of protease activity HflC (stomatin/prohibitin superfamily)
MTKALFWIILFFTVLAPIGARAVFNPEEENPGNYNKVQDDKDKQEREAKYQVLKREQSQAETVRQAEAEANAQELNEAAGQEEAGFDWSFLNRWAFNLTIVAIVGGLGWYGWKHNTPRPTE